MPVVEGNGDSARTVAPQGGSVDAMSGSDALLWNISTDPVMRPTIVAVMILGGAPAWSEVRKRVDSLTESLPRLRSRAVPRGSRRLRPQFVPDPDFDLGLHLRRVRLPDGAGRRHVLDLAQAMATSGFDHALPLWEATMIEGLEDGEAALVMKVHHALIDGVGGLAALGSLFDRPDVAPDEPRRETQAVAAGAASEEGADRSATLRPGDLTEAVELVDDALDAARHPVRTLGSLAALGTSVARLLAPATRPVSPLMQGRGFRRHVEAVDLSLADLRRAAQGWGGTLNDVFVSAVVRGLSLYHEQHGVASKGFRVLMPVNVRDADDRTGGNRFVPVRFVIPVHTELAACVEEVQMLTGAWKHAPGLALSGLVADGLSTLPARVTRAIWGSMLMGIDFCITNVPGPPAPVAVDGAQLRAIYAVSPPSGAAFNVSLVSTADRACVAVTVDTAAVPDSAKLAGCIDDGFAEVCSVRSR